MWNQLNIILSVTVPCTQRDGSRGNGTTQGNCNDRNNLTTFCYANGVCGLCSKDGNGENPGNGTTQGNCSGELYCYAYGCDGKSVKVLYIYY